MKHIKDEERPLTYSEERALFSTARKVFLKAFPNPERQGCPSKQTLKSLVYRSRKFTLQGHQQWFDHIAHCSPCYQEFLGYRREYVSSKRLKGTVLALLSVGLLSGFLFKGNFQKVGEHPDTVRKSQEVPSPAPPSPPQEAPRQMAILDIRHYSVLRGESPPPVPIPLSLPRGRLRLSINLPIGMEEGKYDVQLVRKPREVLTRISGYAKIRRGIGVVLEVDMDTSPLSSGPYLFRIREAGWDWRKYDITID